MEKNQYVVSHRDGWAVKGGGNARATKVYDKQCDAIDRARESSQKQHSELLMHGRDGQIRERDSHGHDPNLNLNLNPNLNPPKG